MPSVPLPAKETLRADGNPKSVVFVAATALEYKALRKAMPGARVVQTGVALTKLRDRLGETVVSAGLAGGLRADLPIGTVLIPRSVRRPGGEMMACDPELVEMFARAARVLGIEPVFDPLLTADQIVNGAARAEWAERGFAGVDMETGRLSAARIAAVRVILDTPAHELSGDWSSPLRAMLQPKNWREVPWLAREAPRAAELAARVVASAQGIAERVRITGQ